MLVKERSRSRRRAFRYGPGALCALGVLALLAMACGVTFSEGADETEVFKRLVVLGDLVTSNELTLGVDYEQPYSAALEVQCDLLAERAPAATSAPAPPTPVRPPTATPIVIPAPRPTPKKRVSIILVSTIGPNGAGTTVGESTPIPGSLSGKFIAPLEPGRYTIHCYTTADDNNGIVKTIDIRERSGPAAAPR